MERVKITVDDAFGVGLVGAIGAIVGIFATLAVLVVVAQVAGWTMQAEDVRAICAKHGGVVEVYDSNGVLTPAHLVVCRDGWVDEPKP